MYGNNYKNLKKQLDDLYRNFSVSNKKQNDPVQFIYNYKKKDDQEIIAFLCSTLALGRVEQIIKTCKILISKLGDSPQKKILDDSFIFLFSDFKHRFFDGADITTLLTTLRLILLEYGTLENLFISELKNNKQNYINALNAFALKIKTKLLRQNNSIKKNLIAIPQDLSACKRLCLFMKWMIRKDSIDPGVWNNKLAHLKKELIIPLDAHIAKFARKANITNRKNNNWTTAVEITKFLKKLNPDDPLKYDFAICHLNINQLRKLRNQ